MCRAVVLSCVVLLSAACGTAQTAQRNGDLTRKLNFKQESNFRESPAGKKFKLVRSGEMDDLRYDKEFQWIRRTLLLEGLKETTSDSADYKIEVKFHTEKPFTGIPVGIILPYKHSVTLKARRGDQIAWQVISTGPSEYEERREFTAVLLGAARHYFGRTTTGPTDFSMSENDPKVQEILKL